ncbi:MAG: efflux RND transporter periplasmic adaptor subunit [Candidatus Riflebacteria bacterium]|nr:efflux RND transporter periplasmic adaptor subunit [Candidatus Riflebacteria bacterium]
MTPRMWRQLIEVRLRFVGLLVITGLIVGCWDTIANYWERFFRSSATPGNIVQELTEFFCPMHPNIIRSQNGNCPICGMPLSKRAKGVLAPLPPNITGRVTISPYQVSLAGIKTAAVSYQPLVREIESLGEVVFDERKLARVSARYPGRIEKLLVNFVGAGVQAGEPLAQIYSPPIITTFEELLTNSKQGSALGGVSEAIKKKLLYLGITPDQIETVLKKGGADNLTLTSPMNGVVVKKSVIEGQYVEEGMNLFDLANLNVVWLVCRVFEDDMPYIRIGQSARFETPAYPGASFTGTVAFLDPTFEKESRTVNVRIDLNNTAMKLKPGMFGTTIIQAVFSDFDEFRGIVQPVSSNKPDIYTCVMHPEIEQSEPGKCPKCLMKLTLKEKPVEANENLVYSCPMHPEVKSGKAGKCPICKPYMDMDLEPHRLETSARGVLAVPETAVIDTGTRKIVYVEQAEGIYEGRLVSLGPRADVYYPVFSGLKAGEKIVAHGSFLIDAETRLNPAAGAAFIGNTDLKPTTIENLSPASVQSASVDLSNHGN